jgi:hypothetical protein
MTMHCPHAKRLVAQHLIAIKKWKKELGAQPEGEDGAETFAAWKEALNAEQVVFEHRRTHGCHMQADGFFGDDTIVGGLDGEVVVRQLRKDHRLWSK